jgi:hypothetical protein
MGIKTTAAGAIVAVVTVMVVGSFQQASADRFQSTNYTIDASTGNSTGGAYSSTSYRLTGSGGESVIGNGSGGSYKMGQGYVAQLEKSIQMSVQPGGLIAYYPLDEGAGTTAWDGSANNNTGAGTNTTWTTGKVGGGVAMNGSDRYVDIADSSSLDPSTITVSAWLNSTTNTTFASAVSKWNNTTPQNGEWILGHGSVAGTYRFLVRIGGTNYDVESSTGFSTGAFHHVVGTYDGSTVRLYVDGVEVGTPATITSTMPASSTNMRIGNRVGNTNYYNGTVDEVKVFSKALLDKEVKAEYNAGVAGHASGISLNTITPGVSQTALLDAIVQTDAPDYTLAVNQDQNLTSGGNSIPAVSGSIASPVTWSEGSTKGLGFTLVTTNATAIPGTWSSGSAYAAFPGSATSFYTRNNYTAGSKDVLNMRLRIDTAISQAPGDYSNVVTWTGTMTP